MCVCVCVCMNREMGSLGNSTCATRTGVEGLVDVQVTIKAEALLAFWTSVHLTQDQEGKRRRGGGGEEEGREGKRREEEGGGKEEGGRRKGEEKVGGDAEKRREEGMGRREGRRGGREHTALKKESMAQPTHSNSLGDGSVS